VKKKSQLILSLAVLTLGGEKDKQIFKIKIGVKNNDFTYSYK